jgi:hypothetical protein
MFEFMRARATSAKGRPNRARLALEELETRDVPAALAAPTSLLAGLAPAPIAVLAGQATTNGNENGAAGEIPALFNGKSVTINVKQLSDKPPPQHSRTTRTSRRSMLRTIWTRSRISRP